MAISKLKRFEVFKRDGFRCVYCGGTPPDVILQVDHVIPVSKGGTDSDCNLVTSCAPCNSGKRARIIEEIPGLKLDNVEERRRKLTELKALAETQRQQLMIEAEEVEILCDVWAAHSRDCTGGFNFPMEVEEAVRLFLKYLPVSEVQDSINVAFERKRKFGDAVVLRYFCGVCWTKIKDPEFAKELSVARTENSNRVRVRQDASCDPTLINTPKTPAKPSEVHPLKPSSQTAEVVAEVEERVVDETAIAAPEMHSGDCQGSMPTWSRPSDPRLYR